MSEPNDIVTEAELLKRIPVSRRTLWKWRDEGTIPYIRLPNSRRVLFHWPSVHAALLRQQTPTNDAITTK